MAMRGSTHEVCSRVFDRSVVAFWGPGSVQVATYMSPWTHTEYVLILNRT
jgi:hypothetical protein